MAKNGKCRVIYNQQDDSYVLELKGKAEAEWGTVMIAKCKPDAEGEPTMIHYTFLTELLKTVALGYELIN